MRSRARSGVNNCTALTLHQKWVPSCNGESGFLQNWKFRHTLSQSASSVDAGIKLRCTCFYRSPYWQPSPWPHGYLYIYIFYVYIFGEGSLNFSLWVEFLSLCLRPWSPRHVLNSVLPCSPTPAYSRNFTKLVWSDPAPSSAVIPSSFLFLYLPCL